MRINIVINDNTIRADIVEAVETAEKYNEIAFPTEEERECFINECADDVIYKYECYMNYVPNYDEIVLDAAKDAGYLVL